MAVQCTGYIGNSEAAYFQGATNSVSTDAAAAGAGATGGQSGMEVAQALEEFISSGRTGRRNAMPDILDNNHAATGTGGLACGMEKLNCSDTSQTGEPAQPTASTSTSKGS